MGNALPNSRHNYLMLICMILMMISLLVSRAVLSVSTILFVAVSLLHRDAGSGLRRIVKDPFLIMVTLLFFIPFISVLWSSGTATWSDVIRVKLPLLFFPVAFAGITFFDRRYWLVIAGVFLLVVFAGACYSLWEYLTNMAGAHQDYLKAKVLDTPFGNDHVRFSWVVSVAVMCCFLLASLNEQFRVKVALWMVAGFFIFYLHLLAARTGLVCVYAFLLACVVRHVLKKKKTNIYWLAGIAILVLPFIAWKTLPTFHNRFAYIRYDLSNIQKDSFIHGSNDGNRLLSLKAGWQVLNQHPFGAGAGDLDREINAWYRTHYPNIQAEDKLNPCSEWLMYGGFAGWPGMLLFTAIMALPYCIRPLKHKFYWTMLHVTATFSFAFDMGLEVQYGVFCYAFIILWWYQWFNQNSRVNV